MVEKTAASMTIIERLTATYADRRRAVAAKVQFLEDEIRRIRRKHMPAIKQAVGAAKDARTVLHDAIDSNPSLFEKPRTRTLHGIKVGFRKLIGTLSWESAESVVRLVRKHFDDKADVLIKTTETPVKKALEQLPAADLKRLGVSVGEDSDEVVISPADSEVDKLVEALLTNQDEDQ